MLNFLKLLQRGACMLNHSVVSAILWTVACQALLSMGFPRQEYWSRLPFPTSRDPPDSGFKSLSLASPALQADSLLSATREVWSQINHIALLPTVLCPPYFNVRRKWVNDTKDGLKKEVKKLEGVH